MIFDNNYHYNAMPIRLLVNIQDADSAGIQTASENNNGTRMGYNHPMEKNTLSARAHHPLGCRFCWQLPFLCRCWMRPF